MTKALKGKDGFLFLSDDTNNVIDQLTGKHRLSQEELARWQDEFARRCRHSDMHHYYYQCLLVPNKHCVYQEFLPDGLEVSQQRPAVQLARQIPELIYYPLDLLRSQRDANLYYRLDTHWNALGCAITLNGLMEKLGCPRRLNYEIVKAREDSGDLANNLADEVISLETSAIEFERNCKLIFDNRIHNVGRMLVTEHQDTSLPVAVIFGDSFFTSLALLVGEFFSKMYYFHAPVFDTAIIEEFHPDVVINQNIERFVNQYEQSTFSQQFDKKIFGYGYTVKSQVINFIPYPHKLADVNQDRAAEFVSKYKMCDDEAQFDTMRMEYLLQHNLLQYLPRKTMRPTGAIWAGNAQAPFVGWAAACVQDSDTQPRAVAFILENIRNNVSFRLSVYEVGNNCPILELSEQQPVYARSYTSQDLFLYDDIQEVIFETPGIFLRQYYAYMFCIEGDGFLGAMGSWTDLPLQNYLFRGYYRKKDDCWRVIANTGSLAWRVIK